MEYDVLALIEMEHGEHLTLYTVDANGGSWALHDARERKEDFPEFEIRIIPAKLVWDPDEDPKEIEND